MRDYYVIVRDESDGRLLYNVGLMLEMFWECDHDQSRAKRFATRAAAAKHLQSNGKHRQGWRVLKESNRA
jgi:muconolactone delta-isomerase